MAELDARFSCVPGAPCCTWASEERTPCPPCDGRFPVSLTGWRRGLFSALFQARLVWTGLRLCLHGVSLKASVPRPRVS